jgi:hypothetical protein
MNDRPGLACSPAAAVGFAPAGLLRLPQDPAGLFQFPLHPPAKLVVPVEPSELRAGRCDGEPRPLLLRRQLRPANRLPPARLGRVAPALAIFRIFQIIDLHFLPRWLEPTTAGRRPPARTDVRTRSHARRRRGLVGRRCYVAVINTRSAQCRIDVAASMVENRGAILTGGAAGAKRGVKVSQ